MSRMTESFGRRLAGKQRLLGGWCTFASFASTEVMTHLGYDFLVIDMQHGEITTSCFPSILGAFREPGPAPVVRVPQNDYHMINWLLDQGVGAIMVPMVNSVEDARRAVAAAKFPPLGRRSFGPYRAAGYSFQTAEYMPRADELATLIVQVESEDAARDIERIAAVEGVDAVFAGPNDLAFSMLKPGQSLTRPSGSGVEGAQQWTAFARTPEVMALCEHMLRKVNEAGLPFGITAGSLEEARRWHDLGAAFVTFSADFLLIRAAAAELLHS